MLSYTCVPQIPVVAGLDDKITVGRHIILNCEQAEAASEPQLTLEKIGFKTDESQRSNYKLFKVSGNGTQLSLDMTFYVTGEQKIEQLVLSDGANDAALTGPPLKIESVLQPPPDGKPQAPFGSVFPMAIGIPTSYLFGLGALLLLLIGYSFFKAKRLAFYKKLKTRLNQYSSPIEPDTQFYKAIRAAEKSEYPLDQIENAFRLYNVRAYKLPLFELPDEKIPRYFRRNYPQNKNTRISLQKILNEFSELKKKNEQLTPELKNEFVKKLYRYVEKNRGLTP